MSSIRLSGTSSGYYDLTVPAAAGTNSIDLSNLAVKDSSGNLAIDGDLNINAPSGNANAFFKLNGATTASIEVGGSNSLYLTANNAAGNIYLRNGTSAQTNMTISTAGHVTQPNQPSFMVYGAWSYAASTYIWKGFATVDHNIGSHWNNTTGRFTAPIAGRYMIYAAAHHSGVGSYHLWAFLKNGSAGGGNWVQSYDANGGNDTTSKTQVWNLAAGDYLEVASNATYPNGYNGGYVTVGGHLVG